MNECSVFRCVALLLKPVWHFVQFRGTGLSTLPIKSSVIRGCVFTYTRARTHKQRVNIRPGQNRARVFDMCCLCVHVHAFIVFLKKRCMCVCFAVAVVCPLDAPHGAICCARNCASRYQELPAQNKPFSVVNNLSNNLSDDSSDEEL